MEVQFYYISLQGTQGIKIDLRRVRIIEVRIMHSMYQYIHMGWRYTGNFTSENMIK